MSILATGTIPTQPFASVVHRIRDDDEIIGRPRNDRPVDIVRGKHVPAQAFPLPNGGCNVIFEGGQNVVLLGPREIEAIREAFP